MSYFLDSGYLIALGVKNEQRHRVATRHWNRVLDAERRLITTTFVLDETVTYVNRRGTHSAAVEMGLLILNSPVSELIHVDFALLMKGWSYFVRHQDKRYSLTDCISFVVMKDRGVRQALTFDQHFSQAGFECLPKLA